MQRISAARREREAKLFIVQTLTHELRTPAATLGLTIENVRKNFDSLPESAQVDFLRICDETQRLKRIIEASSQYLSSQREMQFNFQSVPSLNDYFVHLLEPYGARVHWQPLAADQPFQLDPYWLGLCVKNLVDNGLLHGKPPVRVALTKKNSGIKVSISDGGETAFCDLKEMVTGVWKKQSPKGLGLGLSLVVKVIALMKGQFSFSSGPTTFSILLRSPV